MKLSLTMQRALAIARENDGFFKSKYNEPDSAWSSCHKFRPASDRTIKALIARKLLSVVETYGPDSHGVDRPYKVAYVQQPADVVAALDTFTRAYLECALWSSSDESTPQGGEPMDLRYSLFDFALETLQRAVADCTKFQTDNGVNLALSELEPTRSGHLFWLNRNGHGSGFWDECKLNSPQTIRDACDWLSEASKQFGEVDLYVGDDKQLYFS